MARNSYLKLVALSSLLAVSEFVTAQSFNIDLDVGSGGEVVGAGVPDPTFGAAANQAGVWNNLSAPSHNRSFALRGLDGAITSAQLHWTESGSGGGSGWVGNDGGYRLLLNDYKRITIPTVFTFSNLMPGLYTIYTYAVDPSGFTVPAEVFVPDATVERAYSGLGPMPGNQFVEGVTHCIHQVNVSGSAISLTVSDPEPGSPGPSVAGFQLLSAPVPEPYTGVALVVFAIPFLRFCYRRSNNFDLVAARGEQE